ncbi:MAG: segregation/condensation protein A [Clostridia bacterium]|nr:segregation/condensation protein A [Clostridia bacterium]
MRKRNALGNIRLDVFQGPLDLLLTLLERQEIDVRAIPVAEVTAQYLEYIQEVEELDLEWAGEFIVLGAELLALKARLLLQRPREEELLEGDEEDPAEDLTERLLTYRMFKKAAQQLEELARSGALVFGRPLDQEAVTRALEGINPLAGVTATDLARALAATLNKAESIGKQEVTQTIRPSNFSLLGQIRRILKHLQRGEVFYFDSFLSPRPIRLEVALTFLALLELARRGRLTLSQEEPFGVIKVARLKKQNKNRGEFRAGWTS